MGQDEDSPGFYSPPVLTQFFLKIRLGPPCSDSDTCVGTPTRGLGRWDSFRVGDDSGAGRRDQKDVWRLAKFTSLDWAMIRATLNRELGNLKQVMAKAVEWELLPQNPFAKVKLLPVPNSPERILREDEEVRLLAACERVHAPYLRPILLLALNTGMRKGEILSLEWSQIDLDNRTIRIDNAKTKQGERRIPMNDAVWNLL